MSTEDTEIASAGARGAPNSSLHQPRGKHQLAWGGDGEEL